MTERQARLMAIDGRLEVLRREVDRRLPWIPTQRRRAPSSRPLSGDAFVACGRNRTGAGALKSLGKLSLVPRRSRQTGSINGRPQGELQVGGVTIWALFPRRSPVERARSRPP
jgi:hypothetical protein